MNRRARPLFDRVFAGSDEMFAKAEADVNQLVAELGADAPMTMPNTAYFLACIYAYIGKKVTTVGELQAALAVMDPYLLHQVQRDAK